MAIYCLSSPEFLCFFGTPFVLEPAASSAKKAFNVIVFFEETTSFAA